MWLNAQKKTSLFIFRQLKYIVTPFQNHVSEENFLGNPISKFLGNRFVEGYMRGNAQITERGIVETHISLQSFHIFSNFRVKKNHNLRYNMVSIFDPKVRLHESSVRTRANGSSCEP
jgi:hypothetical protein